MFIFARWIKFSYLLHIGITEYWVRKLAGTKTKGTQLETTTNEPLGIENGVARVHGCLIFCGVTDQSLFSREGNIGRCCPVTLLISMSTSLNQVEEKGSSRSLAMISTRSFCQTPTHLRRPHEQGPNDMKREKHTSMWYRDQYRQRHRRGHPF